MSDKIIIDKIKKHSGSEIWIVLEEYQSQMRCHVREYYRPDDGPEWRPTTKGVSIPPEVVTVFVDAVEQLSVAGDIGEIASIPLGQKAKISFGIRDFKKHIYAEIRVYYHTDSDTKKWKPGKGVTIPPALVSKLAEALRLAEDQLDEFEKR